MDGEAEEPDRQTVIVEGNGVSVWGGCSSLGSQLTALDSSGEISDSLLALQKGKGIIVHPSFPESVQNLSSSEEKNKKETGRTHGD